MKNKENLEIALRVGAAHERIRNAVISEFSDLLIGHLKNDLDNTWQIESRGMFRRREGIRLSKREWGTYWIEIAPEYEGGGNMYLGVRNQGSTTRNDAIKQRMNTLKPANGDSGLWPWYFFLAAAYLNWDTIDLLLKMQERDTQLLEYVREQIVAVAKTAEPVIDEIMASQR